MVDPKRDPYHTQPDDAPSYPQDEADAEQQSIRRKWAGKAVEAALDILGEVVEGILDNIG